MRSGQFIGIFFMACLPLGCANWQDSNRSAAQVEDVAGQAPSRSLQLVAGDFVMALQQIPTLPPSKTTVQFLQSALNDSFTLHMQDALQQAGYGTRWVSATSGSRLFQYRHERLAEVGQVPQELYEIAVGNVEMRRRYTTDAKNRIAPITPLYVRGADASRIRMDDSRFKLADGASQGQSRLAGLANSGGSSSAEARVRQPRKVAASVQRLAVPSDVNPLNPLIAGTDRQRQLSLPLMAIPRAENVFDIGGSNYQDILAGSRLVREQVLTFANDSLRLGSVNKILVEQMVESFQPETDMFSVLGCSLGPTRLESGNAALALGRASRVREALLFAGVPQNRILDEGCWADDGSGKALPRRGVVVTLNRKA